MPIGIIIDVAAVALGGILGGALRKVLPKRIIESLFIVTAFCAFGIGIVATMKLQSMTVVMVSVILGSIVGELCFIEGGIGRLIKFTVSKLEKPQLQPQVLEGGEDGVKPAETKSRMELLMLCMAIFCFSGTGFFGALNEGMDGDSSILLAKSALDFFTAMVLAAQIGYFVSAFSIPQAVIFFVCFFLAKSISPILTVAAISNFKAVGGVLTLVIGYNVIAEQSGLKKVRVLNLTPAFILVIAFTWLAPLLPIVI
jgi:uncharacterized membrane protein YqgA involved in biofilm formation